MRALNRYFRLFMMCFLSTQALAAQICEPDYPATTPTERFKVLDAELVEDSKTGLVWMRCMYGMSGVNCEEGNPRSFTWEEALQEAANVGENWRLPNIKELLSIVERKCTSPAINPQIFPGDSPNVWSSSSFYRPLSGISNAVQIVNFGEGGNNYPARKSGHFNIRLVRDSQKLNVEGLNLISTIPSSFKDIYPNDQIKLTFDSNINYSSINEGLYFLNISTQEKIYLDSGMWNVRFGGNPSNQNNKELIFNSLRLTNGKYELHYNQFLKNESDEPLNQDGKIAFNLYKPNEFIVKQVGETYEDSGSRVNINFSVFNEYSATSMSVKVSITGGKSGGWTFDIGAAYVGGPSVIGFKLCEVTPTSQRGSGSYIEDTVNYSRMSGIVFNGTNKSINEDVEVTLCNEKGVCESFNYNISLNPTPNYPQEFCNP